MIEGSYAGGTAYSGDNDRPGLENGRAAASASLSPPTPFLEIGGDRVAEPGQEVMVTTHLAPPDLNFAHDASVLMVATDLLESKSPRRPRSHTPSGFLGASPSPPLSHSAFNLSHH